MPLSTITISHSDFFKHENVCYVKNEKNIGFGSAVNVGVKLARSENIVLLNPDTKLLSDINIDTFESITKNKYGLVGGVCFDENEKYKRTVGKFPISPCDLFFFERRLVNYEPFKSGDFRKLFYSVDYTEGSLYCFLKSRFLLVGGFDERIFLYGEDYELSYRFHKLNFDNVICSTLKYYHKGGYGHEKEVNLVKGLIYFSKKHHNLMTKIATKVVLKVRYNLLFAASHVLSRIKSRRTYIVSCLEVLNK